MNRFFLFFLSALLLCLCALPVFASDVLPVEGEGEGEPVLQPPVLVTPEPEPLPAGYMPYDDFIAAFADDGGFSVMAVQSVANTPVTASSANGFKKVLLELFGDYMPTITQLRYQSNTSTNYTYVNQIDPDYPWLCSAGIFAIALYCTFKLGGTLFCKV